MNAETIANFFDCITIIASGFILFFLQKRFIAQASTATRKKQTELIIKWGAAILIVFGILLFIGKSLNYESEFEKGIRIANSKTPRMIDEETRIDKIEKGEGKTIIFHFTLVNTESKNISPEMSKLIEYIIRKRLLSENSTKQVDTVSNLLKSGATLTYKWYGKDNILAFQFSLTNESLEK